MAEKKRKGRRAHLQDFSRDVTGEFQYTGTYRWYVGGTPFKQVMNRINLLTAALCLALFAMSMLPAPSMLGMGNYYVILPYIAELICSALSVYAAVRLIFGGAKLRSYVYEASVEKLPGRLTLTAIFAGACVTGNLVYLIMNGLGEKPLYSLAIVALHWAVIAVALLLKRCVTSMEWSGGEEEPEA